MQSFENQDRTFNYTQDDAGRVTQMNDGAKVYAQGMTYAAFGGLAQMQLGNGLIETTGYNHRGQVSKIEAKAGTDVRFSSELGYADPVAGIYNNGNVLWQRTQRGANTWRQGYQYDGLNRLKQVSETQMNNEGSSAWQRDYAFNRWGNMWVSGNSSGAPGVYSFTPQAESNFDTQNRLHIQSAGYDAAGNQTSIGGFTFGFDGENRMVSSTILGNTATYAYDGEVRRVKKNSTVFVYDAFGKLAAEYGGTTTATGTQYLTADHLGSPRLVTNATGGLLQCRDYLPFGEELTQGNGGRPACYAPANEPTQKFTGKERDSETGLDYFLARYYSPAMGRFTSPDEFTGGIVDPFTGQQVGQPGPLPYADITDPQTLNKYVYVRNSPLQYTDPDGHCPPLLCGAAIGAAGGATGAIIDATSRIAQQKAKKKENEPQ